MSNSSKNAKKQCKTSRCKNFTSDRHNYCSRCRHRKRKREKPVEYLFQIHRQNAKKRGIVTNLTLEQFRQFWTVDNADLWPRKLRELHSKKSAGRLFLSVDRIDADLPYQIGNIQVQTISQNSKKWHKEDKKKRKAKKVKHDPRASEAIFVPILSKKAV